MKRAKLIVWTGVLAMLFISASMAYAQKPTSALVTGITKAADLQTARQGTYTNGDTGVGTYECAWEWQIGTGAAYKNTQGPSARGLLAAFEVTGKAKYLKAAKCAADQAVARYEADTTARPYSEDVILLVELAQATRNPLYMKRAMTYHARTRAAYPTGAALADHYIDIRLSIAGWDLSSQIQAALAVGQRNYARDIALRLIERRDEWEGIIYGGWDYTEVSHAALVDALRDIYVRGVKVYQAEILNLTLQAQVSDGSWSGDYQNTAFALMGLAAAPPTHKVKEALEAGMKYLLSTQTVEGGWNYPEYGEYGEVNGEVLSALSGLVRHGCMDWR